MERGGVLVFFSDLAQDLLCHPHLGDSKHLVHKKLIFMVKCAHGRAEVETGVTTIVDRIG